MTDMSVPKGWKYSKKLSEATEADVLQWIEFTEQNAPLVAEVEGFGQELDKLCKMFTAKTTLTELQATHVEVKDEFTALKTNMAADIAAVPGKLSDVKAK